MRKRVVNVTSLFHQRAHVPKHFHCIFSHRSWSYALMKGKKHQAPTQTPCLARPSCLSPIRLFKAEQLLESPCDICSVGSTGNWTETGAFYTSCLSWVKTVHDRKIKRCSTWTVLQHRQRVCALKCGWQSTAAINIFPKTWCCTLLELNKYKSYKMHNESITWWTQNSAHSSASIPQPPELCVCCSIRARCVSVRKQGR